MTHDPNTTTEVGLNAITYDKLSEPAWVVNYDTILRAVRITGAGYVEGSSELRTAYSLHGLTVKQASALELGLRIFEFLRTGEYPGENFGRPDAQDNCHTYPQARG